MRAFGADVELIDSPEGITPTTIPRMMARAREIVEETGRTLKDVRIETIEIVRV